MESVRVKERWREGQIGRREESGSSLCSSLSHGETQRGWEMRWEVPELNVRSGRDVADFWEALHTHSHTHSDSQRGCAASWIPLNSYPPLNSLLPFSPPLTYFCRLNFPLITPKLLGVVTKWIVAIEKLQLLQRCRWWLFPSVISKSADWRKRGKNAGRLPPLWWNVSTKGGVKLWSAGSHARIPAVSSSVCVCEYLCGFYAYSLLLLTVISGYLLSFSIWLLNWKGKHTTYK